MRIESWSSMPGIVQVKVVSARDLPIMDRSSELTDAFVEVKLAQESFRTEVCPKTLHPTWDSQWFKFNVDDEDLQDEPLQIKLMDHDTYSAHDAIGKVYISLNSLIHVLDDKSPAKTYKLAGWFPIFDTLHGIRGEVLVRVKLDLLRDQRRFQQSSCGVRFFACQEVPWGYSSEAIHGFIEELVVNDDPEYQWIDKIRTPRASNEARQRLFLKLSGELQRRVGLKALETGGNAVIGYQQCFDLEGESGIVVRGIGTCVSLVPNSLSPGPIPVQLPQAMHVGSIGTAADRLSEDPTLLLYESAAAGSLVSPKHLPLHYNRKTSSSDSEGPPSSPVKSAASAVQTAGSTGVHLSNPPTLSTTPITPALKRIASSSEFPFYTLSSLPMGILRNIGGLVLARSVKLLDKINNPDEPETRDAWWQEVRNEVRSHTRAMGCNVVIGYSESTSICDTLCIFSAMGTAVRVGPGYALAKKPTSPTGSDGSGGGVAAKEMGESPTLDEPPQCGPCHIPYSVDKPPFDIRPSRCAVCNSKLVPSVLLSTGQVPGGVCVRGKGCLIQARVCNPKRKIKGDENAFYISKQLPFLEHKLHSRLLNKLHMTGMNAVFGLKMQVTIGDSMLIGIATGTAVYLEALRPPSRLILGGREPAVNPPDLSEVQAALDRAQDDSRKRYQLEKCSELAGGVRVVSGELETSGEEEQNELDLSVGKEMAFIVDVDEQVSEEDLLEIIVDRPLPQGFHASSTYSVPGIPQTQTSGEPKMVTMVMKKQLDEPRQHLEKQFTQLFHKILQALAFHVRGMHPCALTNIRFDVDLPEEEEVQIAVTAMATRLEEADQANLQSRKHQSEEMIFPMEEGTAGSRSPPTGHTPVPTPPQGGASRGGGPVWMTSLPVFPGYHVEHYLGIINLFLIKESTSIRENGGLNSFMHVFLLEAHAVTRAQVAALGGNGLLSYRLHECVLIEHPHKNQAQCLLNLSGDAVLLRPGGCLTDSGSQLPIEFEQEPRAAAPVQASVPGSQAAKETLYRVTEL